MQDGLSIRMVRSFDPAVLDKMDRYFGVHPLWLFMLGLFPMTSRRVQ